MKKYRVAILGCRGRGTAAARAYHAHPRTQVVGLCDLVPELVDTLGHELGVDARYDDLDKMIVETKPDIVAIPTGTEFHYPLAMRVLEHGVHIEVEKPICIELNQADEVLAKASEKGVRVAVHHQSRTGGLMRAVHRAIADGRIGKLRHINGSGKGYYGGYGLLNIATHSLNSMMKLSGHCRRVYATARTDGRPIGPEDVVPSPSGMGTMAGEAISAHLEFDGGVTANLLQHRMPVVDKNGHVLEFLGTEGRAIFNTTRGAWLLEDAWSLPGRGARCVAAARSRNAGELRPQRQGGAGRLLVRGGIRRCPGRGARPRVERRRSDSRAGDHHGHLRVGGVWTPGRTAAGRTRPSAAPMAQGKRSGRPRTDAASILRLAGGRR